MKPVTFILAQKIATAIKNMEFLGVRWPKFGHIYRHLFYRQMLKKELLLANLRSGHKLLHVGCGSFSFTALFLAESGFKVDAVDNDPRALERAAHVVRRNNFNGKIHLRLAEGEELDCSEYDVVWVSFYVSPRHECVEQILSTLKPGARIIYRNPRGWLSYLYARVEPEKLASDFYTFRVQQNIGKETVVIHKKYRPRPKGGDISVSESSKEKYKGELQSHSRLP